jgi:hypothetical protein
MLKVLQMASLSQPSVLPSYSPQVIPTALLSLVLRCSIPEAQAHLAAAPSVCEAVRSALAGPGRKRSADPLETLQPAVQWTGVSGLMMGPQPRTCASSTHGGREKSSFQGCQHPRMGRKIFLYLGREFLFSIQCFSLSLAYSDLRNKEICLVLENYPSKLSKSLRRPEVGQHGGLDWSPKHIYFFNSSPPFPCPVTQTLFQHPCSLHLQHTTTSAHAFTHTHKQGEVGTLDNARKRGKKLCL